MRVDGPVSQTPLGYPERWAIYSLDGYTGTRTTMTVEEAVTGAAKALLNGKTVEYEPGDGTRYLCVLVTIDDAGFPRRALVIDSLGSYLKLPRQQSFGAHSYAAQTSGRLRGSWMGLRPLLTALGYARGPLELMERDRQSEFEARSEQGQYADLDTADAKIGRKVRDLLAAETGVDPVVSP